MFDADPVRTTLATRRPKANRTKREPSVCERGGWGGWVGDR
jgi:hypothetical protein